jgi:hypothetical protein
MRTRLCSPRKGCHEPFDANDVAPAPSGTDHVEELVQVCCLAIVFVTEEEADPQRLCFSARDAVNPYAKPAK